MANGSDAEYRKLESLMNESQSVGNALDRMASLTRLRDAYATDMKAQEILAPYEHEAAARGIVGENPLMAVPMGLATPLYQLGKLTGLTDLTGYTGKGSTPASLKQLGYGFKGIGEGLYDYAKGLLK